MPPDARPSRRRIGVAYVASQPRLHRRKIAGAQGIQRIRSAAVIGTDRVFEVAVTFFEHELHPQSREPCSPPRVVVIVLAEEGVDASTSVQLTQTLAREK